MLAELIKWDEERLFHLLCTDFIQNTLEHFTKYYKQYHGNPLKECCDEATLQFPNEELFTCQNIQVA